MKDYWLKLGCFLTGYNYFIVKKSSEASAKSVKKFLSALLIVSTLWGFIGFAFTRRYLHGTNIEAIIGAIIMIIIVIQIERQIILTIHKNQLTKYIRIAIGVLMAIIGSVIIDQVLFKDDIEEKKISNIQESVNKTLPVKTLQLDNQILHLDTIVNQKEKERLDVIADVGRKPTIMLPVIHTSYERDTSGKMIPVNKTVTNQARPNPKADLIPEIDTQITKFRDQKREIENKKLTIRQDLEKEYQEKKGFLQELKVLFSILFSNPVALVVWIFFFLFFLLIEVFVLVAKYGDLATDYDKAIIHQVETNNKMIDSLTANK